MSRRSWTTPSERVREALRVLLRDVPPFTDDFDLPEDLRRALIGLDDAVKEVAEIIAPDLLRRR